MERIIKYLLVFVPVFFCLAVGCAHKDGSLDGMLFGDNLQVMLEYGGIPAVILLFGYLYLRSLMKEHGRQLARMQEQLNNQQIAMNVLIQNNTKALTRLGTAMMMGCPFIRGYLDANDINAGEGGCNEEKTGGSEVPG